MHFPTLKNCGLKALSNPHNDQNFSRYFAGTGNKVIADTWRKEYKSRTFELAHYFSHLPRDDAAQVTRTRRKKKKFSNAKYYDREEGALFRCWNYIFLYKTTYFTLE